MILRASLLLAVLGLVACDDGGADVVLPDVAVGYMEICNPELEPDACTAAGDQCFPFNNKGPHCTHECTTADDCPAPSGGCGNQGVCKPQ